MQLLGKKIVEELKAKIKEKVGDNRFTLAIIAPTNDKASLSYVNTREKLCSSVGVDMKAFVYDGKITENEIIELIDKLNKDKTINGIMVDRPLANHIDEEKVFKTIDINKDIDGCSLLNAQKLARSEECMVPSTALAVETMLDYYKINVKNKEIVIVNDSISVGKPLRQLLTNKGAKVCVCDETTKNVKEQTQKADIVITAIGKANYFDASFFNKNATVIDVGINFDENGNLCGDVKKEVEESVLNITPVPGGVGPITNVMLLVNLLKGQKAW